MSASHLLEIPPIDWTFNWQTDTCTNWRPSSRPRSDSNTNTNKLRFPFSSSVYINIFMYFVVKEIHLNGERERHLKRGMIQKQVASISCVTFVIKNQINIALIRMTRSINHIQHVRSGPKENLRYTNVWPYAIDELESILDNSNCSSRNLPLYFHQTASK